jgi:hypothetical protein
MGPSGWGPATFIGSYVHVYSMVLVLRHLLVCCSKIAEAEAAVSVNEKKWLVMHMHVQLQLDELRGPQTLGSPSCMCLV